eukprot:6149400-Ditylum_brightwellii.AAC.1
MIQNALILRPALWMKKVMNPSPTSSLQVMGNPPKKIEKGEGRMLCHKGRVLLCKPLMKIAAFYIWD